MRNRRRSNRFKDDDEFGWPVAILVIFLALMVCYLVW